MHAHSSKKWIDAQEPKIKDGVELSGGEKGGMDFCHSDDSRTSSLQILNVLCWVLPTCQMLMEFAHRFPYIPVSTTKLLLHYPPEIMQKGIRLPRSVMKKFKHFGHIR